MSTVDRLAAPANAPSAMMPKEMRKRLTVSRSARRFIVFPWFAAVFLGAIIPSASSRGKRERLAHK